MSMLASLLCTRRGKNFAHYTETLFLEHIFTGDSEPVPEIKKIYEYKHFTLPSTCSAVFSNALRMLLKE